MEHENNALYNFFKFMIDKMNGRADACHWGLLYSSNREQTQWLHSLGQAAQILNIGLWYLLVTPVTVMCGGHFKLVATLCKKQTFNIKNCNA